jgi:hypothetical protein
MLESGMNALCARMSKAEAGGEYILHRLVREGWLGMLEEEGRERCDINRGEARGEEMVTLVYKLGAHWCYRVRLICGL